MYFVGARLGTLGYRKGNSAGKVIMFIRGNCSLLYFRRSLHQSLRYLSDRHYPVELVIINIVILMCLVT